MNNSNTIGYSLQVKIHVIILIVHIPAGCLVETDGIVELHSIISSHNIIILMPVTVWVI